VPPAPCPAPDATPGPGPRGKGVREDHSTRTNTRERFRTPLPPPGNRQQPTSGVTTWDNVGQDPLTNPPRQLPGGGVVSLAPRISRLQRIPEHALRRHRRTHCVMESMPLHPLDPRRAYPSIVWPTVSQCFFDCQMHPHLQGDVKNTDVTLGTWFRSRMGSPGPRPSLTLRGHNTQPLEAGQRLLVPQGDEGLRRFGGNDRPLHGLRTRTRLTV